MRLHRLHRAQQLNQENKHERRVWCQSRSPRKIIRVTRSGALQSWQTSVVHRLITAVSVEVVGRPRLTSKSFRTLRRHTMLTVRPKKFSDSIHPARKIEFESCKLLKTRSDSELSKKKGGIMRPKGIFFRNIFGLIHLADLRVLKHFWGKSFFLSSSLSSLSLFIFSFIFPFIFCLLFHLVSSLVLLLLFSSLDLHFFCLLSSLFIFSLFFILSLLFSCLSFSVSLSLSLSVSVSV